MKNLRISLQPPESENYPGALTVTQHTINTSPPFLRLMGTPTSIPNDTVTGHSFLSTVAKYSNDLPQAEMIARELAYNAPEIRDCALITRVCYKPAVGLVQQKMN